ncbi:GLUG motif-containing protein [Parabacteroides goldsteinii]|uniref:GLUG motif-containing protein n=1 Tax=Parabacteroides goldsteinii TaxID=328812 RepID=UPI0026767F1A|nr:GLUG motif-containing protein [Parabacteroides goldsteinii]
MKPITTYRQTACRLLAALFFLCLFAPMAAGQDNWKDRCATQIANKDGGNGTSWDKAIEIATAEELAYFAQQVNNNAFISYGSGNSIGPDDKGQARGFISYYFALAADIDLSDYDWTPIGNATYPFKGNFDGRGHCVNGLKVMKVETVSGAAYAGLFGYASVGILRNLGVRLADEGIQANSTGGSAYAGGIAGYAHNIFNCYVVGEGTIEASFSGEGNNIYAGGIVGYLDDDGSLINCYATVNVKVEPKGIVNVGGIVGYGSSNSTISCTYATGDVETGTGAKFYYAGGICGYLRTEGTLTNSLAVNGRITGGNSFSNRIVGNKESNSTLTGNYAFPEIQVNGSFVSNGAKDNENGDPDVDLDNFGSVLTWGDGWDTSDDTHLPQLKMQTGDGPTYSYIDWPTGPGYIPQPSLDAATYFLPKHILHIVSPTGGTLKVTDKDGNELSDGSKIVSGTLLTLSYTESPNYRFSEYLSGSSADNLRTLSGNTIQISDADLYLSARFNYEDPTPPPPPAPIYYSVFLPGVEGAVTDPVAGTYDVESWSTFRFYLTLDADYDESQPVVTTSRGETLQPRTSDGAYLLKNVCTDVEVFIDGIEKNPPPVANEPIRAESPDPEIWSEDACLCIRLPEGMPTSPVRIFTPEGRLLDSFRSTPGLMRRQLPTGIYIVQVGATVRKVAVKVK